LVIYSSEEGLCFISKQAWLTQLVFTSLIPQYTISTMHIACLNSVFSVTGQVYVSYFLCT